MLSYLRDKLHSARLQARYQRIVQERLLDLVEAATPEPVADDPGNWTPLGEVDSRLSESDRTDARAQARELVLNNPHARNLLRLLEVYVVGPEMKLTHTARAHDDVEIAARADGLWSEFLTRNRRHFSYREYARRSWRDGECFLRKFPSAVWPPTVRFIDPETIGPTTEHPDSGGIVTDPQDVESPVAYLRIDVSTEDLLEEIVADDVFHTKIGVDSNQKRGVTIFLPVLDVLDQFDRWLDTELTARKLQASIVLWRKVQGSPSQAGAFADAAQSRSVDDPYGTERRERYRAGTILTTSQGTDLEFLQPNTNFADAVPLGRLLLLCTAAGAGLPEFMLTSDASNGNFASTMVAEGPAVKLFESEQHFFAGEFALIWEWVMSEAMGRELLPTDFFERVKPQWSFPQLVNRDRPKERMAEVRMADAKILSRAEVARRDGVEPVVMRAEIAEEGGDGVTGKVFGW